MAFTDFFCDATSGSNTYGGDNGALYTSSGGTWNGVQVFTPTDGRNPASFVTVGQFGNLNNGAYLARVLAVTSAANGAITLSSAAASGSRPASTSGVLLGVGGAWLGPTATSAFPFGLITAALTDSNGDIPRVNLHNNATFNITSASALVTSAAGPLTFQGYASVPGDGGRAIIDGGTSGASYILLTMSGLQCVLRDITLQNNGAAGAATGLKFASARGLAERVTVNNVRGIGIDVNNNATAVECEAYTCNKNNTAFDGGIQISGAGGMAIRCVSHHNNGSNNAGFLATQAGTFIDCVADSNGGHGWEPANSSINFNMANCTAYANGGSGVNMGSGQTACTLLVDNCTFVSNSAYGVNVGTSTDYVRLSNCGFFGNTSGQTLGGVDATGTITFAPTPLTSGPQGNYTPVVGAGVRNAGRGNYTQTSGQWTNFIGTTSYPDVGAVQHQEGAVLPTVGGVFGGTGPTSAVVALSGIAAGQVLVAFARENLGGNGTSQATPSGWSLLQHANTGSGSNDVRLFAKVAAGTETSVTFQDTLGPASSNPSAFSATVLALNGTNGALPETSSQNTGDSNTATGTGMTVAGFSDLLIMGVCDDGNVVVTPQASMTVQDTRTTTSVATEQLATSGATGNRTATLGSLQQWVALMCAVKVGTSAAATGGMIVNPGMVGGCRG